MALFKWPWIKKNPKPTSKNESKNSLDKKLKKTDRGKWGNKLQFILSCVGYSVGLGNVWRFSHLAYQHGGGAFLIPYIISVIVSGLPLYAMELALGQFGSLGPTKVFARMSPIFEGLGWAVVIVTFNVAIYYNVVIAWALFYLVVSFRKELMWIGCNKPWTDEACLSKYDDERCRQELNDTGAIYFNHSCHDHENASILLNTTIPGINKMAAAEQYFRYFVLDNRPGVNFEHPGTVNWLLVACLAGAWLLVFLCLWRGVQTSGKVVYFTALFPYLTLFVLLCFGASLNGSGKGILFYITPQPGKLWEIETWRQAAVQVFYSLGPAQGGLITLSSYNDFKNNFMTDAAVVTGIDTFTSTFAGFTTFAILGYLANELGVPMQHVTTSGPGMAFVAFPEALAMTPVAPLWSIIFFFMLITLGLDSQFVLYECVTTAILDQYPVLLPRKDWVVGVGCIVSFLLGIPFCLQGGIEAFTIWDDYSSGYVVMFLALYECVVVCWVYGLKPFMKDIKRMIGYEPNWYWRLTWAGFTPIYMAFIFVFTLADYLPSESYKVPMSKTAQDVGWMVSVAPMLACLGFAVYRIVDVVRNRKPWASLVEPTNKWCPAEDLKKLTPARHNRGAVLSRVEKA